MAAVQHADDTPRKPGRPRDQRAEHAILGATLDLVGEVGFAGLTIEAVASRAGVGKATIYRRWSSKEELLLAACDAMLEQLPQPDTGSVRADLVECFGQVAHQVLTSRGCAVMAEVVGAADGNPGLADVLHRFVAEKRQSARTIFEMAIARGEVRADLDIELAVDLLGGPIFIRRLLSGDRIDPADGETVAAMILDGIAP